MPRTSSNWFGKWALITGASAGIGVALAKELALGGTKLVLTARRKDRLEELAGTLTATYKISTEVIPADLADSNAPEKIFVFTKEKGIEIDLLINNAGFGQYGEFSSVEKQRLLDMVQVNCHAVVHLTRLYLPEMIARRRGDILILASTASFQAVPYISTYAATRSGCASCITTTLTFRWFRKLKRASASTRQLRQFWPRWVRLGKNMSIFCNKVFAGAG